MKPLKKVFHFCVLNAQPTDKIVRSMYRTRPTNQTQNYAFYANLRHIINIHYHEQMPHIQI